MKTAEQYKHLYNEIQISKAISYVKMKKFNEAIDTLKEFAKKGSDIAGSASTNLAAIFFLQNDLQQAQKYATIAVELDPYNAQGMQTGVPFKSYFELNLGWEFMFNLKNHHLFFAFFRYESLNGEQWLASF